MHRIRDILRHRPARGARRLVALDVRVKLLAALAAVGAVILSSKPWLPLGVFACAAVCWLALRDSLRRLAWTLSVPMALAAAAATLKTFLTGTVPLAVVTLGPITLTATRDGLAAGVLTAVRVVASVSVIYIFCRATATHEIFAALCWLRVPRSVVEIAILMYRHLSTFLEHAVDIHAAQQLRLGYDGSRRALHSAASLSGLVLLRSLDQAERTHEAMLARGYDGIFPIAPLPRLRPRDAALLASVMVLLFLAWQLAERWPA